MKKLLFFILIAFCFSFYPCLQNRVYAQDELEATYAQSVASYTNYKDCIRLYKLPYDKLFYLALSSVNANKYEIAEMQSRNGYIIFEAEGREFLLNIMKKDKNFTFLKLAPCDNNYYFSPLIPQKIFKYIDLQFNAEVKDLKF